MLATNLFHVSGTAEPSSKKDRGNVAACGGPSEGFVKEVVEGPTIGIEVTIDKFGFANGSLRDRVTGDMPFIESMDVAGEIPSETKDLLLRGCDKVRSRLS